MTCEIRVKRKESRDTLVNILTLEGYKVATVFVEKTTKHWEKIYYWKVSIEKPDEEDIG